MIARVDSARTSACARLSSGWSTARNSKYWYSLTGALVRARVCGRCHAYQDNYRSTVCMVRGVKAVIYARVSSDTSGRAKSVTEQEAECRAVCERNNWHVSEVLVDNDRGASRWSAKDRPEYRRLADVLEAGDVL